MILVVGGAGYIGSHMLKLLREQNEPHMVFDNFESGHRAALQGSPAIRGDLRKPNDLEKAFAEHKDIDVVMHFAAYISVGESVREPSKYWHNNTAGVLNLLDAMGKANVNKFVFSSTAAIFGEPHYVPIDEEHPKSPTSPYGQTKLAVENMLSDFDKGKNLKSVALRYFNASGADPSGKIGEDHDPEEHLIPVAILAALGRRPAMKVFGTDYDTPDGTCVRDYVHVLDLAHAHLAAVKHLRNNGDSRRYNLGNGKGFSVRQVLDTTEKVIEMKVPREDGPRRPGDPATLIASSEKISKDWGWKPQYPDLETIVQHAWQWHKSHPDGYGE
jgi:UDP-glucose 4-epimerase